MRQQFSFYKSFDDVYQDLNDKQRLEFMSILLDVQFLRIKIDDVTFKDNILKHIWNAQKHSIEKSIKGYLESQKNSKIKEPFFGIYEEIAPLHIPSEGVHKEEQVKEEDKEKDKEEDKFSFSLNKNTSLSNTSKEYQLKLKEYIFSNFRGLTYEDFYNSCEMKGYKYKNFKMAYDKWTKDYKSNKSNNHEIFGEYTAI